MATMDKLQHQIQCLLAVDGFLNTKRVVLRVRSM